VFAADNVWIRPPKRFGAVKKKKKQEKLLSQRSADVGAFVHRLLAMDAGRPHVGFKIFLRHNNIGDVLGDTTLKKLVLFRANVLAHYASGLEAEASGAWTAKQMQQLSRPLVHFEGKKFITHHNRYLNAYLEAFESLQATNQAYWVIRHDELNATPCISRMLSFLGASPSVAQARTYDVRAPTDVVSRFSNPEDVMDFLRSTNTTAWMYESDLSFDRIPFPKALRRAGRATTNAASIVRADGALGPLTNA
jgi:hypothetical protein